MFGFENWAIYIFDLYIELRFDLVNANACGVRKFLTLYVSTKNWCEMLVIKLILSLKIKYKFSDFIFKGAYWISSNIAIAMLNFSLLLPTLR